jgi:hypothetical protein
MPMRLDELKTAAKELGYLIIKGDRESGWRPLTSWNGVSSGTNVPNASVQVYYYLEGNRVRVTKALDNQEYWYTLN